MKKEIQTAANIFLVAALASQSLSCRKAEVKPAEIPPTTPIGSPPADEFLTQTPESVSELDSSPLYLGPQINDPELVTITPPIERFRLAGIDLATTPFKVVVGDGLQHALNRITVINGEPVIRSFEGNFPQPVVGPRFSNMEQQNMFIEAGKNNSKGNPYYVLLTTEDNHKIVYFHNIQRTSPGELAREVGGLVLQDSTAMDRILGQTITLDFGGKAVQAEVVFINTVTKAFFNNFEDGVTPWGVYEEDGNIILARTDRFGFPESIRQDEDGEFITIVTCQSEDGEINLIPKLNTTHRTFVTFRIIKSP